MASVWTYAVTVGHVYAPRHTGVQGPGAAQSTVSAAPHAEPGSLVGHLACGDSGDKWVTDSKKDFPGNMYSVSLPATLLPLSCECTKFHQAHQHHVP